MKSTYLCLGLVLIACTACSRFDTVATSNRDLASISAVRSELDAAIAASDADRVAALFAHDTVYLPPGEREIVGNEALRIYLQKAYGASGSSAQGRRVASDVQIAGDWAFEWGQVETIQPPDGGYKQWVDGKYLHVYHRDSSGTWRIARASYNANPLSTASLASK